MAIDSAYLAAVESALVANIGRDGAISVSINGRTIQFASLESLQKHYDWAQGQANSTEYGGSIPIAFSEAT